MKDTTRIGRWWKIVGALALLLLIGWMLTVGFGHGSAGTTGTTTIQLHGTP
jgi:hypothetical protein